MRGIICLIIILWSASASGQTVNTVAGMAGVVGSNNGAAATASFNNPHGVAADNLGNVYVADRYGHKIRKITPFGIVSTLAGSGSPGFTNGTGSSASFNEPWAVACDNAGNVYVTDAQNYAIRMITPAGVVTTVAGNGTFGVTNGPALNAQFGFPTGLAVTPDGTAIYVCDRMTHTIRLITGGNVTTLAGTAFSSGSADGTGSGARFDHPYSLAIDNQGDILVADEWNNKVRKVTSAGVVTTVAGTGSAGSNNGPAAAATFNGPWGITVSSAGDIYVSEGNNFLIREISGGNVSTFAGQDGVPGFANGPALQATLNGVSALWYNPADGTIFIADPYSQLVREVTASTPPPLTINSNAANNTICDGDSIMFTAVPATLSNYTFYNGATVLGTSSNGTLTVGGLTQGSHNITCTAVNGQNQTVTSNTLNITVLTAFTPSITVNGPTTICPGDSVQLTATQGAAYQWSTGANTQSVYVSNAASYIVTVTNSQGCQGTSVPVQISGLQSPTASITQSPPNAVCIGDTVTLTASNATLWQWSTGATTQSITITTPGNYTVLVTNNAGCNAISAPTNISFLPQGNSSITPAGPVLINPGSSVTFTASQGSGYQWSTGVNTQSITVSTAGTFTVTVADANGCESIPATVNVAIQDRSTMALALGSTSICDGDSVEMASSFLIGNQWFLNGSAIPGATQQYYMATLPGAYFLRVTQQGGGPDLFSDTIMVSVITLPASINATADSVCRGEPASLTISPQSGIIYTWYDQLTGGAPVYTGTIFLTPPIDGNTTWYVELSDVNGCVKPDRFDLTAYQLSTPDANFSSSVATAVTGGFEVQFSDNSTNTDTWFWDFGDPLSMNNNSTIQNPVHQYSSIGTYTVMLITGNSLGCSDTTLKKIEIRQDNNIFIPNAFTPNSDGNNDLFRVRGNNISFYEMSIYSPWGQRIWYSQKETRGWDGSSSGEMVPTGTYAYMIEITYDNGQTELHKGNISVIR